MKKLLITLAIAPALAALPALAEPGRLGPLYGHAAYYEQHRGMNVEARLEQLRDAVGSGVGRGRITRQESWRLLAEQQKIDRAWRVATGDGRYTRQERARVENMLAASARHIRQAMRDYDDPRYEY